MKTRITRKFVGVYICVRIETQNRVENEIDRKKEEIRNVEYDFVIL